MCHVFRRDGGTVCYAIWSLVEVDNSAGDGGGATTVYFLQDCQQSLDTTVPAFCVKNLDMIRMPAWVTTAGVLGGLAGVAVWGHETDWTFTQFVHHAPHESHHGTYAAHPESPSNTELHVELTSAADLKNAGVVVGHASTRPMSEQIVAHGEVTYNQNKLAQLSARVPGTAWRVEKQVGDQVRKGDVLALIDASDVGRAKSEFLQALVQAELKQQTLDRLKAVGDAVPQRQLREAESALREASVARFNAQQTLVNLGLPIRYDDLANLSDEARARKIHFLGISTELTEGFDQAHTTANLIPLVAPFDGIVIRREIVIGEMVSPDKPQFVLADTRTMWLKMSVRKEDAIRLAVGQIVDFEADGVPGTVHCRLMWISTEVDEKTRTVQARGEVNNPLLETNDSAAVSHVGPSPQFSENRLLRSNTFGTGHVRIREEPLAVVVPEKAIVWDGKRHLVFVPRADGVSFEPRTVGLGVTHDGFTEVLEGLQTGEAVVVEGSHTLKSEMAEQLADGHAN